MYLSHFGFSTPPFRLTPDAGCFYEGAQRGATLAGLMYAVTSGEGIVKVTGEVGSGKTMLCRVLLEKLPPHVDTVYLSDPSLSKTDILQALADDLGMDGTGQRDTTLIRRLQETLIERYAAGRQVVVLIDEAHAMPQETLEEVRLLSNLETAHHKLLQIVLFGQPELDDILALQVMRPLRERIAHSFQLLPLRLTDIQDYLMFRARMAGYRGGELFKPDTVKLLARVSDGLTRRVNILADKALLAAYADQSTTVEVRHARAAARDSGWYRAPGKQMPWPRAGWATGILFGGAVGALVAWQLIQARTPAAAAAPAVVAATPAARALPQEAANGQTSSRISPPPSQGAAASADGSPPAASALDTHPDQDVWTRRLGATRDWVARSDAGVHTVQLILTDRQDEINVRRFTAEAAALLGEHQLFVYPTVVQGRRCWSVAFGSYATRQAAQRAISSLPVMLQARKPLVRSVGGIRSEMFGA